MNHPPFVRAALCLLVIGSMNPCRANTIALLDPSTQPKFVNALPNPLDPSFIFQPTAPGGSHYEIGVYQTSQWLGLVDANNQPLMTTVWGYGTSTQAPTYPGRTIQAIVDSPITVRWTNNLVDEVGQPLPHLLPVDTSVHWAITHPAGFRSSLTFTAATANRRVTVCPNSGSHLGLLKQDHNGSRRPIAMRTISGPPRCGITIMPWESRA